MKLSNMKVGTRLGSGFAIILALLIAVTLLGVTRMAQIQNRLEHIVNVNNVESKFVVAMRATVNDRMIALRNIVLIAEAEKMQPEVERVKEDARKYASAEDGLNKMFEKDPATTNEEKALLKSTNEIAIAIAPLIEHAIQLGLNNKNTEATDVLLKEIRPLQNEWTRSLIALNDLEEKISEAVSSEAKTAYSIASNLMYLLAGSAILLGTLIAWFATHSITGPLNRAVEVARTVAAGDLTSDIQVTSTDETGQLLLALKEMNGNLQKIVGQVRSGTDTIDTASREIASGNLDLSSRTEEQASSLEETASSMEEITSTVKQNTENALQANVLAQTASDFAVQGGEVVARVVSTMGSINESAKKIVDIIGVIDGIAFQTNILALNAAVEAARAGEQGRGFAVVATEVRSLAQRSANAAKEIKLLIGDSVEKVDAGSKLVNQAGETMDEIVSSVKRVTDIMSEITSASREQEAGIQQINQAINEMDTVTQQNAALVEEAAAAAESLQEQASNLAQVVGVFKLTGSDRVAADNAQDKPTSLKVRSSSRVSSNKANKPEVKRIALEPTAANADWEQF